MSLINLSEESIIQSHWKKNELLHLDGIFYGTGKVLLFDEYDLITETRKKVTILPNCITSINAILEPDLDNWIEIIPHSSGAFDPVSGDRILCGEGAMGNEGFVARVTPHNKLVWGAFFTFSNPFTKVSIVNNNIIAVSEYGHEWVFSLNSPDSIQINL